MVTPSLYRRFSEADLLRLRAFGSIRILAFGGEAFPTQNEIEKWRRSWPPGLRLFNLYGITECSCWASVKEITFKGILQSRDLDLIGDPLPETSFRVLGKKGEWVEEGEGELVILTKRRVCFVGGETSPSCSRKTGDWVRKDGSGIHFIGRIDNLVKILGNRVQLDSLKAIAEEVSWVLLAQYKLSHENYETNLELFIKVEDPTSITPQRIQQLWGHLKSTCGNHALPRGIFLVQDVPVTKNGKLDLGRLESQNHQNLLDLIFRLPARAPGNLKECEEILSRECARFLGTDREVREEDYFLAIGGTSMDASRAVGRVIQWLASLGFSTGPETQEQARRALLYLLLHAPLRSFYLQVWTYMSLCSSTPSISVREGDASSSSETFSCRSSPPPKALGNFFSPPRYLERGGSSFVGLASEKAPISFRSEWKSYLGMCVDSSPLWVYYPFLKRSFVVIGSHAGLVKCVCSLSGETIWAKDLKNRIESSFSSSPCGKYVIFGLDPFAKIDILFLGNFLMFV